MVKRNTTRESKPISFFCLRHYLLALSVIFTVTHCPKVSKQSDEFEIRNISCWALMGHFCVLCFFHVLSINLQALYQECRAVIGYSSLFLRVTGEEGALVNYQEIEIASS